MSTEIIDKLFLELSQITNAKTRTQIDLERKLQEALNELSETRDILSRYGRRLCALLMPDVKLYDRSSVRWTSIFRKIEQLVEAKEDTTGDSGTKVS